MWGMHTNICVLVYEGQKLMLYIFLDTLYIETGPHAKPGITGSANLASQLVLGSLISVFQARGS